MRTAQNKAIDLIRHRVGAAEKRAELAHFAPDPGAGETELAVDDMLRLIFTCCHPAISPDGQVALTLQTLCGLRSEEIARHAPQVAEGAALVRRSLGHGATSFGVQAGDRGAAWPSAVQRGYGLAADCRPV